MTTNSTAPLPSASKGIRIDHLVTNVTFNNPSYYPCIVISNDNPQNVYFIPQGSAAEFLDFIHYPPLGIQVANSAAPLGTDVNTGPGGVSLSVSGNSATQQPAADASGSTAPNGQSSGSPCGNNGEVSASATSSSDVGQATGCTSITSTGPGDTVTGMTQTVSTTTNDGVGNGVTGTGSVYGTTIAVTENPW